MKKVIATTMLVAVTLVGNVVAGVRCIPGIPVEAAAVGRQRAQAVTVERLVDILNRCLGHFYRGDRTNGATLLLQMLNASDPEILRQTMSVYATGSLQISLPWSLRSFTKLATLLKLGEKSDQAALRTKSERNAHLEFSTDPARLNYKNVEARWCFMVDQGLDSGTDLSTSGAYFILACALADDPYAW